MDASPNANGFGDVICRNGLSSSGHEEQQVLLRWLIARRRFRFDNDGGGLGTISTDSISKQASRQARINKFGGADCAPNLKLTSDCLTPVSRSFLCWRRVRSVRGVGYPVFGCCCCCCCCSLLRNTPPYVHELSVRHLLVGHAARPTCFPAFMDDDPLLATRLE